MRTEFLIQKVSGKVDYIQLGQKVKEFFALAKDGCYELELKLAKKHKSHQQVKAIFGLLISQAIEQINDQGLDTSEFLRLLLQSDLPSGVPIRKDTLYDILIDLCPVTDEAGRKLTLSKMSTKQAAQFFTDCQNLLASRGIYIPDPNPEWKKEKEAKQ